MFDWDQDCDNVTSAPATAPVASASPDRGRLRRGLMSLGVPLVVVAALFIAPGFAPASPNAALAGFALSRLSPEPAMPAGLLSYDRDRYDNFRSGIARFSDSEVLAYAAATRRDQANPRLIFADWDRDALHLTELEITRRGLQVPVAAGAAFATRPASDNPL